jgi:hypothetical protein
MSPTGQFICALVAIICFGIAAIMRLSVKAWDAALVAAGLAAWVFIVVVSAAKAM